MDFCPYNEVNIDKFENFLFQFLLPITTQSAH